MYDRASSSPARRLSARAPAENPAGAVGSAPGGVPPDLRDDPLCRTAPVSRSWWRGAGQRGALGLVIVIGDRAWTFDLLRARGQVEVDDLVLTWRAGHLDTRRIADNRDVGGVSPAAR